jgi:hypothetical protein
MEGEKKRIRSGTNVFFRENVPMGRDIFPGARARARDEAETTARSENGRCALPETRRWKDLAAEGAGER